MNSEMIHNRLHKFEKVCRDKGIKLTHQRLEIYKALLSFSGHPSVEDVYAKVKKDLPMISLDTVYRTVASFEELGLIVKLHTVENKSRIDLNLDPHHHLVCTNCKKVTDFEWDGFNQMPLPDELLQWGEVATTHVEIRGLCNDCKKG